MSAIVCCQEIWGVVALPAGSDASASPVYPLASSGNFYKLMLFELVQELSQLSEVRECNTRDLSNRFTSSVNLVLSGHTY